jgi:hypothetical protein
VQVTKEESVADRLVLHIGTQKSGTTYLQRVLQTLAKPLRKSGVLYPTRLVGKRDIYNHEAAAYGLLGTTSFPWVPRARAMTQEPAWQSLVEKVRGWKGTAIVSGEAFSVIDAQAARTLVHSLGIDNTHVIITARDLGRVLPSSWQQHIRNGRSTPFDTYLRQLAQRRGPDDPAERRALWEADPDQTFWRAYAIGSLVDRWAPLASQVTVVAVPHRGAPPDELWHRFRDALELGDALPATPPDIDEVLANVGITEPETLVLAGINRVAGENGIPEPHLRALRGRISREAFVPRLERGDPVRLPRSWVDTVRSWADTDVNELLSTPATIIGDVAEMRVDAEIRASDGPDVQQILDASGAALAIFADEAFAARQREMTGDDRG